MDSTSEQSFVDYLFDRREHALSEHRSASTIAEAIIIWSTVALLSQFFDWWLVLLWAVPTQLISLGSWMRHDSTPSNPTSQEQQRYLQAYIVMTWLMATAWGMVPLLFFVPGHSTSLIFYICIFAGYVSGALAVTFAYTPAFVAFAFGISVPFLARLIYEGGEIEWMISGLMIFYVCILTYVSSNLQSLFISDAKSSFEKQELIKNLELEKQTAIKATEAKNKFLAAASHDLRQPIHAANLLLDVLRPQQSSDANRQTLDKIRQSMQGLSKMLHGLLDISKLDAKAVENQPSHHCLRELVDNLIAEQGGKGSHLKIDNGIPENCVIFADPILVERVVRNLLDNALKYTEQGRVWFTAEIKPNTVVLGLHDTGIGIPTGKLESIFDEFTQLNNPERDRQKGLGLGLAIVKRLCAFANFSLHMDSTEAKGTSISVGFPRGQEPDAPELEEATIDLNGVRVLAVDDEPDILEAMASLCWQWGCEIVTATSLASATASLKNQQFQPQLIVTDFRLKDEESGIDLIRHFRQQFGQHLPAVLVTGDTEPERVSLASESGALVLYKPLESSDLKAAMQLALA